MAKQIVPIQTRIISDYSFDEIIEALGDCIRKELQHLSPKQTDNDELITENEARALYKVSKVTLKSWRDKGIIKGYKIGTRVRYKKAELLNSLLTTKKYGRVA